MKGGHSVEGQRGRSPRTMSSNALKCVGGSASKSAPDRIAMMRMGVIPATAASDLSCRRAELGTRPRRGDTAGESGLHPPEPQSDRLQGMPSFRQLFSGCQFWHAPGVAVDSLQGRDRPRSHNATHAHGPWDGHRGPLSSVRGQCPSPFRRTASDRCLPRAPSKSSPGSKERERRDQALGPCRRSGDRESLLTLFIPTSAWVESVAGE